MPFRVLLATVAAACLMLGQGALAQGQAAAPVPVAKPAAPSDAKPLEVKPVEAKTPDAKSPDAKPAEGKSPDGGHGSAMAQFGGPLSVGSAERPFSAPDCVWTGRRVIHTLMREEVDAASQFTRFYALFGCPTRHIGLTLSCVAAREQEGDTKSREAKVDECWSDPTRPRVPVAEVAPEPVKAGSEEKPPPKN